MALEVDSDLVVAWRNPRSPSIREYVKDLHLAPC